MHITREEVLQAARTIRPQVVEFRRWLHRHPELSFQEQETAAYIARQLKVNHIPVREGLAGTGLIATLKGEAGPGRTIALRADMDALPITEATGLAFSSENHGVMHACGHDAHSASLLGVALLLQQYRKRWGGTVLLIFQPGEEKFPGGASLLLKEGALDNPRPELIIGQHVLPEMPVGHVGFKEGRYMASGDEVYLTIKGKGGHAAMPHTLNDTVLAAAHTVVQLQQIVARFVPATVPAVLSFGRIEGLGATNIIPEKVELAGTLRMMDEEWRGRVKEKIHQIATHTAATFGCTAEINIGDGYPMVYNHEVLTRHCSQLAKTYLGNDKVEDMDLRMTAEDFGYYSQVFPSVFYRFGVKQEQGDTGALHTPTFNLNEDALETACGLMTWLALNALQP